MGNRWFDRIFCLFGGRFVRRFNKSKWKRPKQLKEKPQR